MTDWKASLKATGVGAASGTALGLAAFFFLSSRPYPNLGSVMFLLVPVVAGFSIVLVARRPDSTVAGALLAVLVSLVFLVSMGKEGVLCAVLALPIMAAGLGIGAVLGVLVRKLAGHLSANQTTMLLVIGPTLIFGGERMERPNLQHARTEVVQTTVRVDDSPEKVWSRILSIDSVETSKPFLMYVGLPIP